MKVKTVNETLEVAAQTRYTVSILLQAKAKSFLTDMQYYCGNGKSGKGEHAVGSKGVFPIQI